MPEPILEARSLGRQSDDKNWLVRDVNLSIHEAARIGIVGSSGSGKSVLLRALAALDAIQAGELLFGGRSVHGSEIPRYRTRVAYQHQSATLFDGTVESNLRRPFDLAAYRGSEFNRERVMAWLKILNRDEAFLEKDQQNLSGGERQIVAVLRTLQLDPQILLLDEPTSALDPESVMAVEMLVNHWMAENSKAAFAWVSHDAKQSDRMCDRVYRMNSGRLEV